MASRFALAFPLGVTIGKWTRVFAERQPGVELVVRPSADPLAVLAAGEADMVFARDATADDDRHLIPLYTEDVVVVMHHEHLLTLEEKLFLADLDGETLLSDEPSEALLRSVASGDGIALLPASVAKALRRKDVTAMRLEDGPTSDVGLSWPRDGQHPLVDEFIGIVRGRTAHSSRNPEVAATEAANGKRSAPAKKTAAKKAPQKTPQKKQGKRPRPKR
ncbi:LysR family substrate-binding domain-containing protein [Leifsonia shinshuensis]|uniref:LysR family transcriptional regulator n=1 Tax=Leifsonia shinshuensis TaxID=150026 RepID=A0A7G6Y8D9_9MICO|nr:LysR family substrate-binding domain-containing protein [Leifsonia shinshuensis]QNE34754.1 LysR family transcriptional regulator [Leifsonia shinshuensis]